jgi:hypothetical protein
MYLSIFLRVFVRSELKIKGNRNNICDTLLSLRKNKSMTTTGGI